MSIDNSHSASGQRTSYQAHPQQPQEVDDEKSQKSEEDDTSGTNLDVEKGPEQGSEQQAKRSLVEFEGANDPGNPKNWTPKRRWCITVSMGLMVFTVTFASSIFSVNIEVVQEKFNVKLVTATLGVALFVLVRLTDIDSLIN
jgi:DHA1 family multidrug resistance protein-like MFS transporter